MSARRTRQFSELGFKMITCAAALMLAVSCASTEESEEPIDTGSEFVVADQEEVEDVDVSDASAFAAMNLQTIYFDFDKSDIRENVRPALKSNGDALRKTGITVRLEGYCDERGDEEYNLALGERRATSVKRYLENLGVPKDQMRTLSYGEAKPAVPGHDEAAWRYNRRVEFKSQ
jgi:peptidoglycan-associated lipoprotein